MPFRFDDRACCEAASKANALFPSEDARCIEEERELLWINYIPKAFVWLQLAVSSEKHQRPRITTLQMHSSGPSDEFLPRLIADWT